MNQVGDTRKIEWMEEGGKDGVTKIGSMELVKGDIVRVNDTEHNNYVYITGWAKCLETGDQGERKVGAVKLDVDPVIQPTDKSE